ncbi:hypothetical protein L226DRAFT_612704 [Lentinus tigrinus ALCF2SS1-7]|uniref:Nucleoporin Nup159/Nup146 N-terminal domain-containing protein n=1 Tax=Lentinus tigrinus ALCF2SS1-6 TaxID=1328759 RepID=A0A5C2SCS9_9APHY|nr:hypothetical protein L227DRAFT_546521 [Lentinus tigrinus ALCF2SS1-6]RPD75038.1 hypothetical protein L226DRAFT_612704 [Lentinus tigrinus ALCF2SS1-7]
MNVNQLQSPPQPQLQRFSKDGSDKDADFLALRLLNKRSRLRLSPESVQLDAIPGKGRLFAVNNTRGWFAAATRNTDGSHAMALSPLADLRSALASSSSTDSPLSPRVTLPLPGTPHIVAFTHDGQRLLVAFANGPVSVYDSQSVCQGSGPSSPLHTFPSASGRAIRDLLPCTGDAEHVAILREPGDGVPVEIFDVNNMTSIGGWSSGGPGTNPTSLSWSPKGKQIAIGLENGDVVTYSPTDTSAVKSVVPHPPAVEGQCVISTTWLSNTEYYAIYAPAGPLTPEAEQTHFILSLDAKAKAVGDVKLSSPYLPFPGLRPPGSFTVALRSWDPSRLLLFVGDSTSSDIGLIGSLSDSASPLDSWYNLSLEETSTPSVPLDADLNETVLLGLELDLSDTQPFKYTGASGEEQDVPPPPIMYLYASDGTVTGWHIIQTQGVAYPGMVSASAAATTPTSAPVQTTPQQSVFGTSPTAVTSPFASTSPQNSSGTSTGAFGFSAFAGATSAFGSTSFGQQPAQQQPATSPPSAPAMSTPTISVDMTSSTDDNMASETESGFGGLSLGGGSDASKSNTGSNSMFGSFGTNTQQQPSTSPFGGGAISSSTFGAFGAGPVKPATGFGAFSSNGPSAFGSSSGFGGGAFSSGSGAFGGGAFSGGGGAFGSGASAFGSKPTDNASSENKPASGFGQTAFGTTSTPAFGQSSFGSAAPSGGAFSGLGQSNSAFGKTSFGQSSFGQSAFGQSAFGQTSTPAATTPKPASTSAFGSGGGFASFANTGTSSFGAVAQQKQDTKPVWASSSGDSGEPKSAFGTPHAFAGTTQTQPTSAFGSSGGFGSSSSPTPVTTSAAPASTASKSSPEKPVSAVATPPATPPAKPAETPTQTPAPAETNTPTPTPAPSGGAFAGLTTTPAASLPSTGGAFGGLTTSATGFSKLQPGFGAFGGTTPSSSPFFQKPGSTTSPASSVFGQTSFGSGTTTPTSKPAFGAPSFGAPSFGAPSAFGSAPSTSFFGKSNLATPSPFGKPADSTPLKTPTTTPPSTSAFSAFSGSSSPFSSAAGSGAAKSFGDMLRGGDKGKETEGVAEPVKPVGLSKTAEAWKKPVSVFASLQQAAEKTPEKGQDGDEDAEAEAEEDEGAETSFRSHDDEDEVDDGIDAFLQSDEEDLGSDEEDVPPDVDEEEEVEEGEEEQEEATSSSQPAPESPTVKQAVPPKTPPSIFSGISFTPPTPPKDKGKEPEGETSKPIPVRERSTTPPGSPADSGSPEPATKSTVVPPRATSAPPTSTPGASAPSGFLGVRPSTRPVRSSPLAKPAYSGDDEDEGDEEARVPSPSKKARSESPSVPAFGTAQSRPKTPPVLFGAPVAPPKPAPFSLAPSASPTLAAAKPSSPSPVAGLPAEPKLPTPSASPSPSLAGPGAPGSTSIFGAAPVFTPPATAAGGFFGQKPLGTPETQTSIFGQKPSLFGASKPPALTPPGGGIFSATSAPAQTKPSLFATSTTPIFAGFGTPAAAPAPQPPKPSSLFPGASAATPGPSALPSLSRPPSVAPAMPPASPVQDMQSEFTLLFTSLNKELEDLKALAAHASMRAAQLGKPGSGMKTSKDLTEPTKWVLSDLMAFKQIMKEVERELEKWQSEKQKCISYLRELESDMLKGSTRKEEIERFSKASKDTDFARMLKARMLSPDHLETQSQLRREVRTIRGRLQQLEDYIQSSKKKLNSVKSGKPTLKPPSLDTINRTYRNIDIAIEQEEEDVSTLAERLATLEVSSKSPLLSFSASTRDRRLPDRNRRVGREVTPNIAASTAAALNAERSAQKLKRALLNARKEPLLNTKAVDATPPERELRTPRKPLLAPGSGVGVGAAFAAGLQGGFPAPAGTSATPIKAEPSSPGLSWTPPPPGSIPPPSWSLPPFELEGGSPLAGLGGSRSRGPREKQHAKPIQINREGAKPPPPPPPAGFSWGPVPVIQPKSTISIFAGIGGKGKAKEEPSDGLGESWVADGFSTSTPKK